MAQVAEMGNADVIHPKDEDRILASLHALALIMVCGNKVNRNVPNGGGDLLPILTTGCQSMQNDRCSRSHMYDVVRCVLMAGGDDVLCHGGAGNVVGAVPVGNDSRSLAESDLKSLGVPTFHSKRRGSSGF